ncbi:transaldolase, partial [Bacteroidota bacterium]
YGEKEEEFAKTLNANPPSSSEEFVERAFEKGLQDLFPVMTKEELNQIDSDGKIPVHKNWQERIKNNTVSVDTLMNLAGLASFTLDQALLDERIKSLIS